MFFRNLTMFRVPQMQLFDLADALAQNTLKPVGALELASVGFVSPFGRSSDVLLHTIDQATWMTIGGEEKILPVAVVNDLLAKKLAELEENEGRKPGARIRKRIKEDLVHELLPRAFVVPSRLDVILDESIGVLYVDTSSRKAGEAVVSEIRHALGSFPALPVNAEVAPRLVLTGWLAGDPLPEGLSLGDECELKDPMDGGAVVRCVRQELGSDEVEKHLEAGKQVTRLALTLDDHVSFVLGEDLVIRKFKLLDGAVDQLESTEREDLRAELDARFALMSAEFRRLFAVLEASLRISKGT